MRREDVERRLRTRVREISGAHEREIVPAARFSDHLAMDSLDRIELLMTVEDEFGVEIDEEEAARIPTFGAALEWICRALEEAEREAK